MNGPHTSGGESNERGNSEPIAVVGMGCRLPGEVSNPSALWDLLSSRKTGRREFSRDRINLDGFYHPDHHRPSSINTRGGYLLAEDPRLFDHGFFGMTSTEVMSMDPMQRKLLEVAYEAFESAGEVWETFSGSRTGVYIGNFGIDHQLTQMRDVDFPPPYAPTGGSPNILSNRINYVFNLKGPSLVVDTACSSSMYALHLAVNALRSGDCDAALVGGGNLILSPEAQLLSVKLGALSPTSTCHTFDASADGYARGEGFVMLYLRRYKPALDAQYPIRGIIRATGISSNGRTAGIAHPSVDGQEFLVREVYRKAGLDTQQTGYFECHGTGTPTGDPIEISALGRIFGSERQKEPLLIGSIKTNLGHSEPASGITGVMKVILAMEKGWIPPTIGVRNLNPNINFAAAGVRVVTQLTPWPDNLLRRASVNSFGFGGSNGHCIVESPEILANSPISSASNGIHKPINTTLKTHGESSQDAENMSHGSKGWIKSKPPQLQASRKSHPPVTDKTRRLVVLPFSAHDEMSLKLNITALREVIPRLNLADVAYTLSARRSRFLHKTFSIAQSTSPSTSLDPDTLSFSKSSSIQSARVGFVFTGQGANWQGMGRELFEYKVFRDSVEFQNYVLQRLSFAPRWSLVDILRGAAGDPLSVHDPEISQTVCTALQIAIVDLLKSWNITPHVTVGHSSGEIAASYASGRICLAVAITIAFCRGISVANSSREGLMLAVGLDQDAALTFLLGSNDRVQVAAINSPNSVTLSGDRECITAVHERLASEGIFARALETAGIAYHSHHMVSIGHSYEVILGRAFAELISATKNENSVPWISTVGPEWDVRSDPPTPQYWRQNLESPVRFTQAMDRLQSNHETYADILIEIGPHGALKSPLRQINETLEIEQGVKPATYLSALTRSEDSMKSILRLCGSLFCLNHPVNLTCVNSLDGSSENDDMFGYMHGKLCVDMPTYQYNYGPVLYYENRLSREMRERRFLRHDLLGVFHPGCPAAAPCWRNVLRLKDIPWLKDHKLLPDVVMPASGYVCMAIEAVRQFTTLSGKCPPNPTFQLRNVSISSVMRIPEGDAGLETVFELHQSSTYTDWLDFKIWSYSGNGEGWVKHASGLVAVKDNTNHLVEPLPLDTRMDFRTIDMKEWTAKFQATGLAYGKSFQGISYLRSDPLINTALARIVLHTTEDMFPNGPESRYPVHPASLDLCHQLANIAVHGGQSGSATCTFIPVFIDEVTVWSGHEDQGWGEAAAAGHPRGLRGAESKIQLRTPGGELIVDISNLKCVAYNGGHEKMLQFRRSRAPNPYTRLIWKPDISALDYKQAKEIFPPTVSAQDMEQTFRLLDELSLFMVVDLAERFRSFSTPIPHLRQFLRWIGERASGANIDAKDTRFASRENRKAATEDLSLKLQHVLDVQHMKRIYDNISDILEGKKTAVQVCFKDDLLKRMYTHSLGISAAYPQLERILDLMGHRSPGMKILEIGAGTGGATRVAMRALGGEEEMRRYSSYTFTDVSTGFLGSAQHEFASCKGVEYTTLDLNKDPTKQGFVKEFDLIIASQCLHASKDLNNALHNCRKLLRPGGKMILLETTRSLMAHTLAFGTFSDWWSQDDRESSLITSEEWDARLKSAGFSGIDIDLDDYGEPVKVVSTMITTTTDPPMQTHSKNDGGVVYIIHTQQTEFQELLESALRERGHIPILTAMDAIDIPPKSRIIIATHLERLLAEGSEQEFTQIKDIVRRASSLLWITKGGILDGSNPMTGVIVGILRMLVTENPLNQYGIFHLQPESDISLEEVARLVVEHEARVVQGDTEREIALHNGIIHISRIVADTDLNNRYQKLQTPVSQITDMKLNPAIPMIVDFETPGLLSSLYFKEDNSFQQPLANDYIEVQTAAIGLNWKDVAVSAGRLNMSNFSSEISGTVIAVGSSAQGLQPGDRVYGLALGRFGTHVRLPCSHAQLMRTEDKFEEFATVPVVFCTAVYALQHLARLKSGERVLIQSATGGLGLASIQVARNLGAEIFTTVGTQEKADYLVRKCGIPRDRIFSSRESAAIPALMAATGQRGFNVILSSSNGDLMHEMQRCLAYGGRFIDIGRVDVQNHGTMAMDVFARNGTFSSFDLGIIVAKDPTLCAQLMKEVGEAIRTRQFTPINPVTPFDVSELDKALLYLSKGQHIGKVVVNYGKPNIVVKMVPPIPQARFDPEAEYILTGGVGGLGRSCLRWMIARGGRHFTILTRSGLQKLSPEERAMMDSLSTSGVVITIVVCDISIDKSVDQVIQEASNRRPVKGLLHIAGELFDQPFDTLSYSHWRSGLSAKVQGTINLHEASVRYGLPLDFFVMTSSILATVAMPTQAAYCAANCFQDAFSRYRTARGHPGCAIAFGLITEVGNIGQREGTRGMIARNGLYRTGELEFLHLLEAAFQDHPAATSHWTTHDPLAIAQITTCLDPTKLAEIAQKIESGLMPRWYSDTKFSHLLQAMQNSQIASNTPNQTEHPATSAVAEALDAAIELSDIRLAVDVATKALIRQSATLLMIPAENIEAGKSVAHYGIDSLIAVELRSWLAMTLNSNIQLFGLLDAGSSLSKLAEYIVAERMESKKARLSG